jgi:hypothetical protein
LLVQAHGADATGIDASEPHFYLQTGVEAGRIVAKKKVGGGAPTKWDFRKHSTLQS